MINIHDKFHQANILKSLSNEQIDAYTFSFV
jgi:hypothetical protein